MNPSQILIEGESRGAGRRFCHCQGNPKRGVRSQIGFVVRSVRIHENPVNFNLTERVFPKQGVPQLGIHIFYRLLHAQAKVAGFPISQFHRLKLSGGSAGRNSRPSRAPARKRHLRLHRGISSGVQNLPCAHIRNFQITIHIHPFPGLTFCGLQKRFGFRKTFPAVRPPAD